MSSPTHNPASPAHVRFVSFMEPDEAADLLSWLGDEIAEGRLVIRENGDEWTFEVRGALRSEFEAACRGHSGRLHLRLTWEEPAHGPVAIITE